VQDDELGEGNVGQEMNQQSDNRHVHRTMTADLSVARWPGEA
jgi:hypothetical protein